MLSRKNNYWQVDKNRSFKIDDRIIAEYFDKTQSLVFSRESAEKEEAAILLHLSLGDETRVLDLGCGNGRWGEIL